MRDRFDLASCLVESGMERVDRQVAGVGRGRRQAADCINDLLARDRPRISDGSAADQFGERRGAGDGRDAAFGEKTDLRDAALGELQRQLEHVATGGILQLHSGIGVRDRSAVARMFEMIEKLR